MEEAIRILVVDDEPDIQQDPADPPDNRLIVHHQNADRFFHSCSLLCGVIISHFRKLPGGIKNF